MTATTPETLTVDGVNLKTLAKNVETLAATLKTPARRGANAVAAAQSGVVRIPDKMHDSPVYTWPMWVRGCDDDGAIPVGSSSRKEFYKRVDELTSLFSKDGVLDVRHTLPDGSVRQASCEVLSSLDFTTLGVNPLGKFSVELQNLSAYWQDTADITQSLAIGDTQLTSFAGGTAPIDDGVYVITGPATNPRINDAVKSSYTQYNAVIAAGQTLKIDAKNWTLTGTGGLTVDYSKLVVVGMAGRMVRIVPNNVTRAYMVSLTASATSAATALAVTGRRKFLVG